MTFSLLAQWLIVLAAIAGGAFLGTLGRTWLILLPAAAAFGTLAYRRLFRHARKARAAARNLDAELAALLDAETREGR